MHGNKKISIDKTKNTEMTHTKKPLPRMTEGASVSKHERTKISVSRYVRMGFIKRYEYSDLCTQACPYRLAKLVTSPEGGGS